MRIRCLIENKETPFFKSEHGLSLLIEYNDKKILFDTGLTNSFLSNAKKLNLDLSNINYLVLSHAHYDHASGLLDFIKEYNYSNNIYVGEGFKANKYSLEDNNYIYKGIPYKLDELKNINYVKNELKIDNDFTLYNSFKELNNFEHINPKFYIKESTFELDKFIDETVLTIDTEKGLIVIVGCSHAGICNIIDEVKLRSNKPIRGVIGGFHLSKEPLDYALNVIKKLKEYNLEFICPLHCSGYETYFRKEFKDNAKILYSGDFLDIDVVRKEYNMKRNKSLDEAYGEQTDRNYKDGDRN